MEKQVWCFWERLRYHDSGAAPTSIFDGVGSVSQFSYSPLPNGGFGGGGTGELDGGGGGGGYNGGGGGDEDKGGGGGGSYMGGVSQSNWASGVNNKHGFVIIVKGTVAASNWVTISRTNRIITQPIRQKLTVPLTSQKEDATKMCSSWPLWKCHNTSTADGVLFEKRGSGCGTWLGIKDNAFYVQAGGGGNDYTKRADVSVPLTSVVTDGRDHENSGGDFYEQPLGRRFTLMGIWSGKSQSINSFENDNGGCVGHWSGGDLGGFMRTSGNSVAKADTQPLSSGAWPGGTIGTLRLFARDIVRRFGVPVGLRAMIRTRKWKRMDRFSGITMGAQARRWESNYGGAVADSFKWTGMGTGRHCEPPSGRYGRECTGDMVLPGGSVGAGDDF